MFVTRKVVTAANAPLDDFDATAVSVSPDARVIDAAVKVHT